MEIIKKKAPVPRTRKVSDKEFWTILRKERGIYARTARTIEKTFGISYSRLAVKDRAERYPDRLNDILEETIDIAEEGLHDLMRSSLPNVKLKAIELFLRAKGSHRGYHNKEQVTHSGDVSVNVTFVDESEDRP